MIDDGVLAGAAFSGHLRLPYDGSRKIAAIVERGEEQAVKVVRTRRGIRLVQQGLVLSEIRTTPGPTDSLFDVLAATIAALAPGPDVALLGFAGGGLVAPLRAMGFGHPLEAVDLSLVGEALFRAHSGPWVGRVTVHEDEASRWLRSRRRRRST